MKNYLIEKIKALRQLFVWPRLKKYEIMNLKVHIDYKDQQLKKFQDEGWQICGDVLLTESNGSFRDTYLNIPMKRRI